MIYARNTNNNRNNNNNNNNTAPTPVDTVLANINALLDDCNSKLGASHWLLRCVHPILALLYVLKGQFNTAIPYVQYYVI